jgi:hypothetical protein
MDRDTVLIEVFQDQFDDLQWSVFEGNCFWTNDELGSLEAETQTDEVTDE